MQISRHWRLNSQRYRLQGVRYENGEVSLQDRPNPLSQSEQRIIAQEVIVLGKPERIDRVTGTVIRNRN